VARCFVFVESIIPLTRLTKIEKTFENYTLPASAWQDNTPHSVRYKCPNEEIEFLAWWIHPETHQKSDNTRPAQWIHPLIRNQEELGIPRATKLSFKELKNTGKGNGATYVKHQD
jgi:hypothetical protein